MLGIFKILKTIATVIITIIGFVPAVIIGFVNLLVKIFGIVQNLVGFVPPVIATAFIALVSLCIVLKILGRS